MKALLLVISLSTACVSFNVSASEWSVKGLASVELEAVNEATQSEIKELDECMNDAQKIVIDETSCVNSVFGDVHN